MCDQSQDVRATSVTFFNVTKIPSNILIRFNKLKKREAQRIRKRKRKKITINKHARSKDQTLLEA